MRGKEQPKQPLQRVLVVSSNPWYKRYPSDALTGYSMLTLEERGAYTTLLDLMYDDGEPLLDNERLRAGQLGVPLQRYKKLRNILIDKKKIYMNDDDKISNNRFDEEMKKKAELAAKRAKAGSTPKKVDEKDEENLPKSDQLSEELSLSLSEVNGKNTNEINGKSNQMIDQTSNTNQIPDTRDQKDKEKNIKKRNTSMKEDWVLPEDYRQFVKDDKLCKDDDIISRVAENFKDHWLGNGKTFKDWKAVWRKWCRSDYTKWPQPEKSTRSYEEFFGDSA